MKPGRIKLGATGTRSLLNGLSKVYKIGLTLGLPQRGIDDLKGLKLPPPPIITSCTPLHCRKLNPKCKKCNEMHEATIFDKTKEEP